MSPAGASSAQGEEGSVITAFPTGSRYITPLMTTHPIFPDLSRRAAIPELMDNPDSDLRRLERTLKQLGFINRFFTGTRALLKEAVLKPMMQHPNRRYHLVDLGAGGCDTMIWLLDAAAKRQLDLHVTACDHDPRVIRFAQARAGQREDLTILRRDVMALDDLHPVDVIYANHLLHHLTNDRIAQLLTYLAGFEKTVVVMSDIRRCWLTYAAYYLLTTVFYRNSFARYDGLLSIRKGFRVDELRAVTGAACASGPPFHVGRRFPGRVILRRCP